MSSASAIKKLIRRYHTLKDLRPGQWWFRFWHPLKRLWFRAPSLPDAARYEAEAFRATDFFYLPPPYPCRPESNSFGFLNREKTFLAAIDWNFQEFGLLWAFHLNYLDCLRDEKLSREARGNFLLAYANAKPVLRVGLASYPASVRGINAIRFLGSGEKPLPVLELLWEDACRIAAFPERHLLANHLLENGFALFHAAHFFKEAGFYTKSRRWLMAELAGQILPDGGHLERSPAYHLHVLMRLLQCLELMDASANFPDQQLRHLLQEKAGAMLGWATAMAAGGRLPHFGDSNDEMAPAFPLLLDFAEQLNIRPAQVKLRESGYRKMTQNRWTIWQNVGDPSPFYQPGHAHADPLSFVAFLNKAPFLVSVGVSTYDNNEQRLWERSTAAHNTPVVNGKNASDIWAAFRMGRKARVQLLQDEVNVISVLHSGYLKEDVTVKSTLKKESDKIELCYDVEVGDNGKTVKSILNLYFHPDCEFRLQEQVIYVGGQQVLALHPKLEISLSRYAHAPGFYLKQEGSCLTIAFDARIELIFL